MAKSAEYVVVARRYRPQSFQDLVGQGQVAQALANAITTNRVGHAYLFTGARGVGKTSAARIFAKALNCQSGPTPIPCNECDVCLSVSTGDDVDVLEIDGASNRGIDEIRQLRSNVNIRPSRARFKIYIIDEVHMLTTPAFNALLKTLEEPPEHVKFIFCTTDPEKIPITVLSRCQRFDFPPVETNSILARLRYIVESEGVTAEEEALQLLARRAGGSMRDSQSLLEQLLSFCSAHITVNDVHAMLGTAQSGRLSALAAQLTARNSAGAMREVDAAISEGVDVGQLAEQLLGHFRDMIAALVGCEADFLLHTAASDYPALLESARQVGLESLLAMIQILDQSITRMRQSPHTRILLEVALVRICQLDALDDLAGLISQIKSGGTPNLPARSIPSNSPPSAANVTGSRPTAPAAAIAPSSAEKKSENTVSDPPPDVPAQVSSIPVNSDNVESIWQQAIGTIEDLTADYAKFAHRVASPGPNRVVAIFKPSYTLQKDSCERPERKARIEQALRQVSGQSIRVDFEIQADATPEVRRAQPVAPRRQRMKEREKYPLVRQALELFDAEITRLEEPRPAESSKTSEEE